MSPRFFDILSSTFYPGQAGPGPYGAHGPDDPGSLIGWKNILSQICSRIIFKMHTAPRACGQYAQGAVYMQIMLLDHIWLRIFFQIINGPGPYSPGSYGPGAAGPGPYSPGSYDPGAAGPGPYSPGSYGPGAAGPGP